ncbi:MAG: NAD(P)H-dependent glycerol-3-phosphate dehydrogenase [Candidatus Sedimenticola sp. (ex Thyasira tokunagai)]
MSDSQPNVAVLGCGSWGTALAMLLARNGAKVMLWGHLAEEIDKLLEDGENSTFLPGRPFPPGLTPTTDLTAAVAAADEVLVVVPSHAFRAVLTHVKPLLADGTSLCWATKGLDPRSGRLLHEVATEVLGERPVAVISGPSFAGEVADSRPTAVTVASSSLDHAKRVADLLHCETFRTYTSDDVIGLEVGGAAKNVMAIGAGIADGLGFGANARAALITRGLAEITRLGLTLGGKPETFMGLGGIGDLVLTCTDNQSRNRRMGLALARGLTIDQAKAEIGQEVEGIGTTQEIYNKARQLGVEMPITEQIYQVLYRGLDPNMAVHALLGREIKAEAG